jgi:hypothetical protein
VQVGVAYEVVRDVDVAVVVAVEGVVVVVVEGPEKEAASLKDLQLALLVVETVYDRAGLAG